MKEYNCSNKYCYVNIAFPTAYIAFKEKEKDRYTFILADPPYYEIFEGCIYRTNMKRINYSELTGRQKETYDRFATQYKKY